MRFSWLCFIMTINNIRCSREQSPRECFIHEDSDCTFFLCFQPLHRQLGTLLPLVTVLWYFSPLSIRQRSPTGECATSPPLKWFSKWGKGMQSRRSIPRAAGRTENPNQTSREATAPRSIPPEYIWSKWTRYIIILKNSVVCCNRNLEHSLTCDQMHDVHVWLEHHSWTGPSLTGLGTYIL